jgi:tripartite-type tricarboxylate transporter receptor subunit TctC
MSFTTKYSALALKSALKFSAAALLLLHATAWAQNYPAKNITLIVPYPAGGGTDLFARAIAQDMGRQFERQIIIDNRSGASGNIGAEAVVRAAPDGYTLLYTPSPIAVSKVLSKDVRFDSQRDLRPISMAISIPLILVVHPSMPVKNAKELIALAKARPGTLTYSSAGIGTSGHFTMELLNSITGFDTRHVPYRGAAPALTAVISGEVQMAFLVPPLVTQYLPIGKLRALGISSAARSNVFPQIPTLQEQGVRGYEALQWHGFFGPAAIPNAIVNTLHAAIVKALAHPEVKSRLSSEGAEIVGSTPAQFAAYFQSEVAKWTSVAKRAGIQPQ